MTSEPNTPHAGHPASAPRGCWSRHWKWIVPTGCLTLVVFVGALVTIIVVVVFGALKSTDVYKTAVARAKASPVVAEALGSPVEEGLFLSGNVSTEGSSGRADLSIPLSGPKGKGTLHVVATKSAGRWTYQTLAVDVAKGGQRIDLNDPSAPTALESDDE